jgi:predicted metal-dependent phosphoesterase TrpH
MWASRARSANGPAGALHVHSLYSRDGCDPLERIRQRATAAGMRFLMLTDHAEDFDGARFAEYTAACAALSDTQFTLIPGLEFRFARLRGLHVLACGLTRWAAPAALEDFPSEVAEFAGLVVLAHPIMCAYRVPPVLRNCLDAVEVWNAAYNTRYLPDPRAMKLLQSIRLVRPAVVGVAGLDQHDSANDRGTRVVLAHDQDLVDPLAAIRDGRFTNRGRTMSFAAEADFTGPALLALTAARALVDRVERTQERVARAWRRRSARAHR